MASRQPMPPHPSPRSFGHLVGAVLHWIGSNFWRSIVSAIFAGIVGYAVNVALMLLYYDGYVKTGSGPATGQGNLVNGSLIWALGSTVCFSLWGYRRRVGGKRFWSEMRSLPAVAQALLKADGSKAYVHLLWGAAIALLTMQLVSPWLGGLMAIGILAMLPSFMTRVLVGFGQSVWSWLASKFAPKAAEPPGAVSMVVGIIGSSIALAAGAFLPGSFMSLIMSAVCIGGAFLLMRRDRPPGGTTALFMLFAGAAAMAVLEQFVPGMALAHDGGLPENGGSIVVWWNSDGSKWLLVHATAGGIASGIGAPVGIAIGDMWASEPLEQGILDEILRQPGQMIDPDWSNFWKARGVEWPGDPEQPPQEPPAEPPAAPPATPEQAAVPPVQPPPSQEPAAPPPAPPPAPPRDGDVDPETGKVYYGNELGWVSRAYYDQERARTARIEQTFADQRAHAAEVTRQESQAWSAETAALASKIAEQQRQEQAQRDAMERQRQVMADKLAKAYRKEGRSPEEIDGIVKSGDTTTLTALYKDHLRKVIDDESAKAESEARWATAYDAGYYASKAVLAGAKTAMVVAGGPAGYVAVGIGAGAIRAAEEGAAVYVKTEGSIRHKLASSLPATAGGFLSGVKDGVVGRFTNLPGVGPATKVLLPAAADATETYIRTGSAAEAAKTGLLSTAAGAAGAWQGGVKNTLVRETSQVVLGGAAGAAGSAMSGGNIKEGFIEGMVNAAGGTAGGHAGNLAVHSAQVRVDGEPKPLTPKEIDLNKEAVERAAEGKKLVEDYKAAKTPEERAEATRRILENRDAKLIMKGEAVDPATRQQYADDAEQHRTQPLLNRTAQRLNEARTESGQPRFVVREADPNNPGRTIERPVESSDFKSGSGSQGGPGQDFDMYTDKKIIDTTTGRSARPKDIESHVEGACNDLGFSKTQQEVNYLHETHPEAFKLQPGETPADFIKRAGNLSDAEKQSVSEVNRHKLAEANIVHAENKAGALGEQCRTAVKDYNRLTQPILDANPNARVPERFRVVDSATGETPLDVMRKVGEGKMLPGDGNAKFRAMTGMSLEDGAVKMAGWAEAIAKGAPPDSHMIAGATSRDISQSTVRQILANARRGEDR